VSDLRYSTVEEDLRASVRALLANLAPVSRTLARCEAREVHDAELWRALAVDLGLAGVVVPEELGGAGGTLREAATVLEELGRAVAPVPFLGSAVVAATALLTCGATDLVRELAAGARTVALAVPFSTLPRQRLCPTVDAAGGALTGTVTTVADAFAADLLLVPADTGLYAVPARSPGVSLHPVVSLDLTRPLADVALTRAAGRRVATDAEPVVRTALTAGAALLASEQLGIAEWCLRSTVDHLATRHQFGRPVGSFQAVKHRLADLWVDIGQARAVARHAATCVATQDPDTPIAVAVGQAYCSGVAVRAAEECVQLHGGLGFTWDHPAHLFLKRAKSAALAFGTADRHRMELADLVDLPPPRL